MQIRRHEKEVIEIINIVLEIKKIHVQVEKQTGCSRRENWSVSEIGGSYPGGSTGTLKDGKY